MDIKADMVVEADPYAKKASWLREKIWSPDLERIVLHCQHDGGFHVYGIIFLSKKKDNYYQTNIDKCKLKINVNKITVN